jgi:hypothetical protein
MAVNFSLCSQYSAISNVYSLAVKPDNFLFVSAQQAPDIRKVISASPTKQAEDVIGGDGAVYHVVRSQPIEHGFMWNDSRITFAEASICLSNFRYGRSFAEYNHSTQAIHRISARFTHRSSISSAPTPGTIPAPEASQGGKVDQKSDIWALGIAVLDSSNLVLHLIANFIMTDLSPSYWNSPLS